MCFDAGVLLRCTCLTAFALACIAGAHARAQAPARGNGLSGLLGPRAPVAASATPELDAIGDRLAELARRPDAGPAANTLELGRRALGEARAALAQGQPRVAEQKQQLAWAALALASRQIALAGAASEQAAAARRARAALAALEQAEHELAAAKARLASARAERR